MTVPVTDDDICRLIGSVLPQAATRHGVRPEMSLAADLGVDSIALMSVVFVLEEKLGFDAFEHVQDFVCAEQVADLIAIVRKE